MDWGLEAKQRLSLYVGSGPLGETEQTCRLEADPSGRDKFLWSVSSLPCTVPPWSPVVPRALHHVSLVFDHRVVLKRALSSASLMTLVALSALSISFVDTVAALPRDKQGQQGGGVALRGRINRKPVSEGMLVLDSPSGRSWCLPDL